MRAPGGISRHLEKGSVFLFASFLPGRRLESSSTNVCDFGSEFEFYSDLACNGV